MIPDYSMMYRREIAGPLFGHIAASESCALVCSPSMGISRLLDFVMRQDVQQYYLNQSTHQIFILRVDCNAIGPDNLNYWGLCELLLAKLVENSNKQPRVLPLRSELHNLRNEIIKNKYDTLLALRNLEQAIGMVITESQVSLHILLGEFDKLYTILGEQELNTLKSIRNTYKHRLSYTICLRNFPELIRRDSGDQFTDLINRYNLVLAPYAPEDTEVMIQQLERLKKKQFSLDIHQQIISLSGGYPGLVLALFDYILDSCIALSIFDHDLLKNPNVLKECLKLWGGLSKEEQVGLTLLVSGQTIDDKVSQSLSKRGLIKRSGEYFQIFSPVFEQVISKHATANLNQLVVDDESRIVWVGTKPISGLSFLVFRLVSYLYKYRNQVRTHDEIIDAVYGDSNGVASDERLTSLIKEARQHIESTKGGHRYLINIHGVGYQLFDQPQNRSTS